jgi:hypothetical protein
LKIPSRLIKPNRGSKAQIKTKYPGIGDKLKEIRNSQKNKRLIARA